MRPFLNLFLVSLLAGLFALAGCSSNKSSAGFGAPKNLSASDGAYIDQVKVTWDSVTNAEKYQIYRSDSVDGTYSEITAISSTSYSDTEIATAVVYYYKVKAWSSSDGYSGFSNEDSGSTGSTNNLATPVINVTPGSSSITISWNAVSGAEKYYVYRKAPSDNDYVSLGNVTDTTFSDSTAVMGTTYSYKIRAYSSSGFSAYSADLSGLITPVLSAPIGVAATQTDISKITVTWNAVSNAVSYTVRRSDSLTGTYTVVQSGITALTCDDTLSGLEHGMNYYYTVQATGSSGSSAESSAVGGFSPYAYSAPVLSVNTDTTTIKLEWTDLGSGSYDVYRSSSSSGTYSKINSSPVTGTGAVSYTDIDGTVLSNTIYFYRIRAAVSSINVSALSNIVSAYKNAATDAPAAPTGLSATGSTADITMYWTASSGATGYYVYYSSDGVSFTKFSYSSAAPPTSGSPLSATIVFGSAPVNGATYWIKVSGYNSAGEGLTCSPVIATRALVLGQPVVSASPAITSMTLTISASANATASTVYYVYRSLSSGGPYSEIGNTNTLSFTDATVSALTMYYYKVRAKDPGYGYSLYSASASATTLSDPATPAAPSVTTNQTSTITVTWTSVINAEYYLYRSDSSGIYTLVYSGEDTSYTDSAVEIGNSYYYKVQTCVGADETSWAGQSTTTGSIALSWTAITGAAYDLFRKLNSGGSYSLVYSGLTASYTDSSVTNSVLYDYKAITYVTKTFSVQSSASLAGSTLTSFAAPTGVSASDGRLPIPDSSKINISFTGTPGATAHYLYRAVGSATNPYFYISPVTTPYSDPQSGGLFYETYYFYILKAYDSLTGRYSTSSSYDSGYLQLATPTAAATSGASAGQIYISWPAVTGTTSYTVCYNTAASVAKTDNPTLISGTSTTLSGLDPQFMYHLKVFAVSSLNVLGDSELSLDKTAYPKLAAPTGVTAVPGSSANTVKVSWTASPGASSYVVCYKSASGVVKTDNPVTSTSGTDITVPNTSQTYYFNVYAVNAGTTASDSDLASSETGPVYRKLEAPTGVTAVPGSSANTVKVSWSASIGATSYIVCYKTGAGVTKSDSTVTSTSGADITVPNTSQTYYFNVYALNGGSPASNSDLAAAETGAVYRKLEAPTGVTAVPGTSANTVKVSWTGSTGATSYIVCYKTGAGVAKTDTTVTSTSGTDITVPNTSQTYYFNVYALNGGTTASDSDLAAAEAGPVYRKLEAPTGVTAVPGSSANTVKVSWTGSTGATSYIVCYKTSAGVAKTDTTVTSTSGTDIIVPNTSPTYYFNVYALNGGTTASDSALAAIETGAVYRKLEAPTGVTAVPGSSANTVKVSWTASVGATSYIVCYKTSAGVAKTDSTAASTSGADITVSNASPTYYFNVYALNGGTTTSDSDLAATETGAVYRKLEAPTGVTAVPGSSANTVKVSWTGSTGATSYIVCYKTSAGVAKTDSTATSTSGADITVSNASPTYYFNVYAINAGSTDSDSALAASETGAVYRKLEAPTGVTAVPGSSANTVKVSWTGSTGATSYIVCYKTGAGVAKTDSTAASTSGADITVPNASQTYYFNVYAINAGSTDSDSALAASETGAAYRKLEAPTGVTAVPGSSANTVKVSWTGSTGATSYIVCYKTSAGVAKTDSTATSTSGADIIVPNTSDSYYFNVYAINSGTTTSDSDLAALETSAAYRKLEAPTGLTLVSGSSAGKVTVSWSAVNGATSYVVCYYTLSPVAKTNNPTTTTSGTTLTISADNTSFAIYAVNSSSAAAESDLSSTVSGYPKLAAPTGVTAVPGSSANTVKVSWTGSTGATSYIVCYKTSAGVAKTDTKVTSTSGADIIVPNTSDSYYFNVYAINSGTTTSDSDLAALETSAAYRKLEAPTGLTLVSGSSAGKVTVSWSAVNGATSYVVCYYTLSPVAKTNNPTTTTSGTTLTISADNTSFAIYAVNSSSAAAESDLSSTVPGYPVLAAPSSVTAVPGSSANTLKVSWTGSTGATSYIVCFKTGAGVAKTDNPVTSTSGTDITVPNTSQTYYVNVYALNAGTILSDSALSSSEAGPAYRKLEATSLSFISKTATSITVNWSSATGASSYFVCYNTSGSVLKTDNPASVSGTGTTISPLTSGTYYLNIYPVNGGTTTSDGDLGTEISVTIP